MGNTYYSYRDVKVKIAHRLMKMDGWKVYGYSADNSDLMTDYYDPANWHGVAEKNGYILVVDVDRERKEPEYYTVRTTERTKTDVETAAKIAKLEQMTQARGASEQEEATARAKIEALRNKKAESDKKTTEKILHCPAHKANPPRCNWHIEKDGIILDKGNGFLKFSSVPDITNEYSGNRENWQKFNTMTAEEWKNDFIEEYVYRWGEKEREFAKKCAESRYETEKERYALLDKFNLLIARWNNICGGMVSNGGEDGYIYEEITVTEYKTELKPQECAGEIKDGQCFVVKSGFNYGHEKGYVYRIHEKETGLFVAYRLGKGYKKERTGTAGRGNIWYLSSDFMKWFAKGSLAFCELVEVKTPYEVKKVVKKAVKTESKKESEESTVVKNNADQTPTTTEGENTMKNQKENSELKFKKASYYICTCNGSGKNAKKRAEKVDGYSFTIDGMEFGTTKKRSDGTKKSEWTVTELSSGIAINLGVLKKKSDIEKRIDDIKKVIPQMRKWMDKNADFLRDFKNLVKETKNEEIQENIEKIKEPKKTEIRNLSQFKKAVANGLIFRIIKHGIHEEYTGQIRQINIVQTNAFYSVEYNNPDGNVSKLNYGKGAYMPYRKTSMWDFSGDTIKAYTSSDKEKLVFEIEILTEKEADEIIIENEKEVVTESETTIEQTAEPTADTFADLARSYVTGKQATKKEKTEPKKETKKKEAKHANIIGEVSRHNGIAVYYATNCLNNDILAGIKEKADRYIIISNTTYLSDERMEEYKISFLKIGYDIKREEIGKLSHKEYLKRVGIEPEPGYTGESSDYFTAEEITRLENGEQIEKIGRYDYHTLYFSTPYRDGARMVFYLSSGRGEEVRAGYDAKYCGFIVFGKFYQNSTEIGKEMIADINAEVVRLIPAEETARKNAGKLPNYTKKDIDYLLKHDFMSAAQRHFYNDTAPELVLYSPCCNYKPSESQIIDYMLFPTAVVAESAKNYVETHGTEIYKEYIQYNRTAATLSKIKNDAENTEHKNKRIMSAIASQKTVKIILVNGHTVKVEADAVKRIGFCGYISAWDVSACDRQYLGKDDYKHDKSIYADDIQQITHGGRVLYAS